MKRWILVIAIPFLMAQAGCNGSSGDVNRVTTALAQTVRTFINFFQDNLGSCGDFIEIFNEITEMVESCDNGDEGSFQVTRISVTCADGPPLNGEAVLTLEQDNCRDDDTNITSTGLMDMTLSFSAAGNIGILASTDLIAEDLTFTFDNFQAKVDFATSNVSCSDSGDLTVDGDNCSVSSNCRQCLF